MEFDRRPAPSLNIPPPEALAAQRVLVVGDAMLDKYWFGEVERLSPEAPVPILRLRREQLRAGGAANVAANVRALGATTTLLACVGQDEAADQLAALLARQGIAAALLRDPDLPTTVKLRAVGMGRQLLRVDREAAPSAATVDLLKAEFMRLLPLHDAVLFSDYGKGALAPIQPMVAAARRAGLLVLVDPKGDDYRPYAGAGMLTPNRSELARVVGRWRDESDLLQRVQALRRHLDGAALLLTRSEDGMTLFDDSGVHSIAAERREVADITGAGDTVAAVMAVLMAAGMAPRDAMGWANRAAGQVVARSGTASVGHAELFGAAG